MAYTGLNPTDGIFIFDEAHNVESILENVASFKISTKELNDISIIIKQLKGMLGERIIQMTPQDLDILIDNINIMTSVFL